DIENYIYNLIPDLPPLQTMHENFYPFYVFTATRRFMFFLDPKRTGRVSIKKLVCSQVMEELLELGMAGGNQGREGGGGLGGNWFSAENSLRVYSQYLELDKNQNGLLAKEELMQYSGSGRQPMRLTPAFIDRIFEEITTYQSQGVGDGGGGVGGMQGRNNGARKEGEMDYKTFLDFVLAMENKNTLSGLQYLWKLLSLGQDYMDSFTINYFFRDIVRVLKENGIENIKTEDVQDEIFDMISPGGGDRITFDELWKSGCGETVVEMLIDINGFWGYENRENYAEEAEEYDEEVEGLMT
ncbi:hypothetical protein TrRE_jg1331, partial [Triparma retinervis]